MNDVFTRPSTRMLISALRGCVCGVLKPQGPRNPTVIAVLEPMRGGNDWRLAATVEPPEPTVLEFAGGARKSKTKSLSREIVAMRSAALGARRSDLITSRLLARPLTGSRVELVEEAAVSSRGAATAKVATRGRRRDEECMMKRMMWKLEGGCVFKVDVFGLR